MCAGMTSSRAHWTPLDYTDTVQGSGGAKLADSQVAPLVAQARGYLGVDTDAEAKRVADESRVGEPRKVTNRLKMMLRGGEDFMTIPWFRFDRVMERGIAVQAAATQVRPSSPLTNAQGKIAKYEMLAGSSSPVDAHPATPAIWLADAPTYLITEGVIKGDAALTAQLLASGVDPAQLAHDPALDAAGARVKLQQIMLGVPAGSRVAVLSFVGVANWHQNVEWASLSLKDRDVLVAFDGDLHKNLNVWRQADKLWNFLTDSKHAHPKYLDLGGMDANAQKLAAGVDPDKKLGVDDYLAEVGSWKDLLKLTEEALPPQPERTIEYRVGDVVVDEDDTRTLEYVSVESPTGGKTTMWSEVLPFGGRVKHVSSLRVLNDTMVRHGSITPGAVTESVRGECVIEISWMDELGNKITREVTGPRVLLETVPSDWTRKGANIHADIQLLPAWPPRMAAGDKFLRAIKANRMDDQNILHGWDTMGYVPTSSGNPVYVVGEQSLGATQDDERNNRPGVTEEIMPMASSYGVADNYWELKESGRLDEWRQQVADDFREVSRLFLLDSHWLDKEVGATLMLAALRPTIPGDSRLNIFISGGPSTGKTWAASFMMGFWQRNAGTWSDDNLPGQANDTMAAREHCLARTPLFIVDDLAPSISRQESERQESAMDQSLRARHNSSGKRRGTADGDQRAVAHPRAVQVVTAENRRDVLSIAQRIIELKLSSNRVNPGDRGALISAMTRDPRNPMGRLTAAMIRLWTNLDLSETLLAYQVPGMDPSELRTWAGKMRLTLSALELAKEEIQIPLKHQYGIPDGVSARRAIMVAELLFTLDVLQALATWAGVGADEPEMSVFLAPASDPTSIRGALVRMAAADLTELKGRSVASRLMDAVRLLLESGKAYLESPALDGARPVADTPKADLYNRLAGWHNDPRAGTWVPQGVSIGYLGHAAVESEDGDDLVAHLNPAETFRLAQQYYPSLVPAGQKSSDSWQQVWEEQGGALMSPAHRKPSDGVTTKTRLHARRSGDAHVVNRGIPVRFTAILGLAGADDSDD